MIWNLNETFFNRATRRHIILIKMFKNKHNEKYLNLETLVLGFTVDGRMEGYLYTENSWFMVGLYLLTAS